MDFCDWKWHICVPVPSQDMDFYRKIPWYFMCSSNWDERWLIFFLYWWNCWLANCWSCSTCINRSIDTVKACVIVYWYMIYEFFRYFLLLEIIWHSILFNNINMVDKKYITKLYRQITTFKKTGGRGIYNHWNYENHFCQNMISLKLPATF